MKNKVDLKATQTYNVINSLNENHNVEGSKPETKILKENNFF